MTHVAGTPDTSRDTLPTSSRRVCLAGLIIILVAFGVFGTWAVLANLSVAVIASGTVSVDSFKKTIQHLEGGIVSDIRVDDGDHVTRGDTLIVLDNTQSTSRLAIERTTFFMARAQETRLLAEQNGADRLEFPPDLVNEAAGHARLEQGLSVQQRLFDSRRHSLQGEIGALNEQIQQYREQITGLKQMTAINQRRSRSLSAEADDYRSLFKEGLGNNQRIRELDRQILELQSNSAQARAEMAQLGSRISENRARIETRRQDYQQNVSEQLREAQSRGSDARQRMIALDDQVRRTDIRAPVSGTVVGLDVRTLGAVITPGQPLMSIVPDTDGFFIDARVPVQDIDNVYAGQHADIRFSAFNQHRAPIIDGRVDHVSADSFRDEATGAHYYRARIRVSSAGKGQMTDNMQLLSGMPAEVMIKTGRKTLFEYLSQPVTDMLHRAVRQD
ncbi:HlyD family type I secretion periplasmic adaptor subunit [Larsenimonas rhizosphaerae]|uniref:Membrane fusion protein (MFP) family protein n=1 Tax=Larsenimonas rhizosphaerae TaxID=2944682 RepID=A0AA41ZJ68_9GAMM|nr:HlyD family type I secretion periplasmic adaptor subunit [Larsenimonas rhizosphaerae]MCX2522746.1 HlyD family type I secretion periplasmic adaptor subunit [Larsenimonas rhizosphaerae]